MPVCPLKRLTVVYVKQYLLTVIYKVHWTPHMCNCHTNIKNRLTVGFIPGSGNMLSDSVEFRQKYEAQAALYLVLGVLQCSHWCYSGETILQPGIRGRLTCFCLSFEAHTIPCHLYHCFRQQPTIPPVYSGRKEVALKISFLRTWRSRTHFVFPVLFPLLAFCFVHWLFAFMHKSLRT